MSKRNLLLVSLAFPPGNDSESLQVAKYFKYLLREDAFHIDVITRASLSKAAPHDESIVSLVNGARQIVKVPYPANRYVRFFIRKFMPWIARKPDLESKFFQKWRWAVQALTHRPDVIYSRSFPISSTLMASSIAKHFNVPWILHLSDPWSLSPVHSIRFAKRWNQHMEARCLHQASLISFTSRETIEKYAAKYPQFSAKMALYPNVYDDADTTYTPWEKANKLKIIYTGALVNKRTPISFLLAIKHLQQTSRAIISDLDVVFAGQLDRESRHLFNTREIPVKHIGNLPFSQAMQLQSTADILLLFDYNFDNNEDALFFPSKLLDYIQVRRRVMAITNTNSTTWRVIHKHKLGDCFNHEDILGLAKGIETAWMAWKSSQQEYFEMPPADTAYAASANARRLTGDLLRVCDEA